MIIKKKEFNSLHCTASLFPLSRHRSCDSGSARLYSALEPQQWYGITLKSKDDLFFLFIHNCSSLHMNQIIFCNFKASHGADHAKPSQ